MAYKVQLTKQTVSFLNGLEKPQEALIISWIQHNLQDCYNPRVLGYQLERLNYDYWKYRIGDYRLLTLIKDDKIIILNILNKHCN